MLLLLFLCLVLVRPGGGGEGEDSPEFLQEKGLRLLISIFLIQQAAWWRASYVHIPDCVDECGPSAVPRRVVAVLPTLGTVSSRLIQ